MANSAAVLKLPTPVIHSTDAAELSSFCYAMLTHPGQIRHSNQDACAALPERSAFVVCDGVGGAAGGEVASQLAAESFLHSLVPRGGRSATELPHPNDRLHRAVLAANHAVYSRAQKSRALRGMATTLVAALVEDAGVETTKGGVPHSSAGNSTRMGGRNTEQAAESDAPLACPTLWLANVGDSRCYRLRIAEDGSSADFEQLTCDHSIVEEQIRAGIITRLEAGRSPVRNVITRAVGSAPEVEPDIVSFAIQSGDLFLLASDGLTHELEDDEIARTLLASAAPARTAASLEAAAHALIDAANAHGGRDNITVLLISCR